MTHAGHSDHVPAVEQPDPADRVHRAFTVHLSVSVDRASWAATYGGDPTEDLTEYVHHAIATGLRGLVSEIDSHDGRLEISVRP